MVINGIDADRSGSSVSSAGDVNGDGFDDTYQPFAGNNGESALCLAHQEDSVPTSTSALSTAAMAL